MVAVLGSRPVISRSTQTRRGAASSISGQHSRSPSTHAKHHAWKARQPMRDVFILDAARTPRGRGKAGKGALSGMHPQELLAQTLNHLARKSGLRKEDVEDVVVGCVSEVGEQGANIARNSVLAAGWPDTATGVTLNR